MFGALTTYNTSGTNTSVELAVADVNGDGKRDIVATNDGTTTLSVLLGDGNGGFTLQANPPSTGASIGPRYIAVADVNADGKPDVLVVAFTTGELSVLLGNGTGSFVLQAASADATAGGRRPNSMAVADVNADGKLDVLTASYVGGTMGLLLGNGSGGFTPQSNPPAPGASLASLAVADVNADGKPDVLLVNQGGNGLSVLLGTGTGSFTPQSNPLNMGGGTSYGLAVADVNGDGKLDVLVSNYNASTLGVLLGNGSGGFALQASVLSTGTSSKPTSVVMADVNGDGKLDALTTNTDTYSLGVLLGTGTGSFTLQAAALPTGAGSTGFGLTLADVNGDNKPDALLTGYSNSDIGVLLNTTPGTFLPTRAALPGTAATLAPNPARTSAMLTATGLPATATQLTATLTDALGRPVRRLSVPATGGAATATVPTAGLAAGMYLLQLSALDAQGAALGALPVQRLSVE